MNARWVPLGVCRGIGYRLVDLQEKLQRVGSRGLRMEKDKMKYNGYRDLKVFQLAYKLAMNIFEITKSFPTDEKYSLVDQIRRSSRSVPAKIAEAWKKRRYPKMFVSKVIDAAGEAGETEIKARKGKDI